MLKRNWLKIFVTLVLATGLFGVNVVFADDSPGDQSTGRGGGYVKDGKTVQFISGIETDGMIMQDFSGMTAAEIDAKYKMSPEEEAKIVHEVPPCPEITIDGILYKSEDIHKFDGQQLGFTTDSSGTLYAFTTEEGIAKFREAQK
ncbi:MAG: hypothetical protein PHE50_06120 [Dehalococcoidales bacterium]|nr:hypothetical protein [Dehalococcoidales bacterium]